MMNDTLRKSASRVALTLLIGVSSTTLMAGPRENSAKKAFNTYTQGQQAPLNDKEAADAVVRTYGQKVPAKTVWDDIIKVRQLPQAPPPPPASQLPTPPNLGQGAPETGGAITPEKLQEAKEKLKPAVQGPLNKPEGYVDEKAEFKKNLQEAKDKLKPAVQGPLNKPEGYVDEKAEFEKNLQEAKDKLKPPVQGPMNKPEGYVDEKAEFEKNLQEAKDKLKPIPSESENDFDRMMTDVEGFKDSFEDQLQKAKEKLKHVSPGSENDFDRMMTDVEGFKDSFEDQLQKAKEKLKSTAEPSDSEKDFDSMMGNIEGFTDSFDHQLQDAKKKLKHVTPENEKDFDRMMADVQGFKDSLEDQLRKAKKGLKPIAPEGAQPKQGFGAEIADVEAPPAQQIDIKPTQHEIDLVHGYFDFGKKNVKSMPLDQIKKAVLEKAKSASSTSYWNESEQEKGEKEAYLKFITNLTSLERELGVTEPLMDDSKLKEIFKIK